MERAHASVLMLCPSVRLLRSLLEVRLDFRDARRRNDHAVVDNKRRNVPGPDEIPGFLTADQERKRDLTEVEEPREF